MNDEEIVVAIGLILTTGAYMFAIVFTAPLWLSLILAACVVVIFYKCGGSHTVGPALTGVGIIAFAYPILVLTGSYTLQSLVLLLGMVPLRMAWGVYRKKQRSIDQSPARWNKVLAESPICKICNEPMYLLDKENQKWYCLKDNQLFVGGKGWTKISIDKKPIPTTSQQKYCSNCKVETKHFTKMQKSTESPPVITAEYICERCGKKTVEKWIWSEPDEPDLSRSPRKEPASEQVAKQESRSAGRSMPKLAVSVSILIVAILALAGLAYHTVPMSTTQTQIQIIGKSSTTTGYVTFFTRMQTITRPVSTVDLTVGGATIYWGGNELFCECMDPFSCSYEPCLFTEMITEVTVYANTMTYTLTATSESFSSTTLSSTSIVPAYSIVGLNLATFRALSIIVIGVLAFMTVSIALKSKTSRKITPAEKIETDVTRLSTEPKSSKSHELNRVERLEAPIAETMPQCPLCKGTTEWKVYFKSKWIKSGYNIVCGLCDAEWEHASNDWAFTPTVGFLILFVYKVLKGESTMSPNLADDNRMWTLKKSGKVDKGKQYVGKKMRVSDWKTIPD